MAAQMISKTTAVSTTPVLIATGMSGASWITIHCESATKVYVGGATVDDVNGFEIHPNSTVTLWLPEGIKMYAVVKTGSVDLSTIQTGGA
jgi:hypothetical protein